MPPEPAERIQPDQDKVRRCRLCGARIYHDAWDRLCDSAECEREFAEGREWAREEEHREIDERFGY